MEVHSPVVAKRLWNVLRITFFMIRKGLISKRKMIMDMNLMMKKGKLVRKSLSNLIHHHHHHNNNKGAKNSVTRGGFGVHYEFSCSNSPNPCFVPKRKHHFSFPCIHAPEVAGESDFSFGVESYAAEGAVVANVAKTPECGFNLGFEGRNSVEVEFGERKGAILSPFSVRVSNYSALDESEVGGGNGEVDDEAEDFIRRFYEQLRKQSPMRFLRYQHM